MKYINNNKHSPNARCTREKHQSLNNCNQANLNKKK